MKEHDGIMRKYSWAIQFIWNRGLQSEFKEFCEKAKAKKWRFCGETAIKGGD